jgi:hypothetical protein
VVDQGRRCPAVRSRLCERGGRSIFALTSRPSRTDAQPVLEFLGRRRPGGTGRRSLRPPPVRFQSGLADGAGDVWAWLRVRGRDPRVTGASEHGGRLTIVRSDGSGRSAAAGDHGAHPPYPPPRQPGPTHWDSKPSVKSQTHGQPGRNERHHARTPRLGKRQLAGVLRATWLSHRSLKIVVSPVRVRVSPLRKGPANRDLSSRRCRIRAERLRATTSREVPNEVLNPDSASVEPAQRMLKIVVSPVRVRVSPSREVPANQPLPSLDLQPAHERLRATSSGEVPNEVLNPDSTSAQRFSTGAGNC